MKIFTKNLIVAVMAGSIVGGCIELYVVKKDYESLNEQCYKEITHTEPFEIEEKHGFQVVKGKSDGDMQTIVAVVTDVEGDGNVTTRNLYDKEDIIEVEGKSLKVGDIVTITFDNDYVKKVEKQHLELKSEGGR